jgi:hypothetical protein
MKLKIVLAAAALLIVGAFAFAQAAEPATAPEKPQTEQTGLKQKDAEETIRELYAKADYAACRALLAIAFDDLAAGKLQLSDPDRAVLYVYQALIVYAFRETGAVSAAEKRDIESLLQRAIELDINYNFSDYTAFPAFILEQYRKIKETYLARFAKSTRRHSLGIHVMMSYLSAFIVSPQFFTLGLHYALSLNDYLALFFDAEVPVSDQIFNLIQFRVGVVWFSSFKVDTFSLGLGLFNSLKVENWSAFTDSVSFEGYGEIVFRWGMGLGASIEIVRLDLLLGAGAFPSIENTSVFSTDKVRLAFSNVRLYLFWTF